MSGVSLAEIDKLKIDFLSCSVLLRIYKQTFLPIMDYGCIIWGDCVKQNVRQLKCLQNQATHIILNANQITRHAHKMRSKLRLQSLAGRRRFLRLQIVYWIINNINCLHEIYSETLADE